MDFLLGGTSRAVGSPAMRRRYSIGVELLGDRAHARVWAPRCSQVELLRLEEGGAVLGPAIPLEAGTHGYFGGWVDPLRPGDRYGLRLDGARRVLPDPASRFQPEGPLGPSQLIDARSYAWRDDAWSGVSAAG